MTARLFLLGAPRLEVDQQVVRVARRKALALAAYLALAEGPQSRDVVVGLLWPDLPQDRAHAALRSTLPALIPHGSERWLLADREQLLVDRAALWVDVHEFRALLASARQHGHDPEALCPECLPLLARSLALYHGDFMAGFSLARSAEYEDWQRQQREWLRRELAGWLRRASAHFSQAGESALALDYARRWLALDPLHEPAHRQLMRLYAVSGQRSEALRQYQECAALLEAELATPPEDETTALYAAIEAGAALAAAQPASPAPAAPGLLPTLPALIIGREEALAELKRRVGAARGRSLPRPLTVIQGWPGVGKSTIVAALAHDVDVARQFQDGV